jgi:hypothetical protein
VYLIREILVELLSQGEKEELQWDGDYNALEIEFEPTFIDTLLEKPKLQISRGA